VATTISSRDANSWEGRKRAVGDLSFWGYTRAPFDIVKLLGEMSL